MPGYDKNSYVATLHSDAQVLRARLKELLIEKSLRIAQNGEQFVLSSGQTSSHYFDGKKTTTHPEGLFCVARLIWDQVDDLEADAVGGPVIGADPIVAGVALISQLMGHPLPCFMVRKESKGHGTRNRIEGAAIEGKRVVLIEDVITTGGSMLSAIQAVRESGAEIVKIIAVIDREQGAVNTFGKGDMEFQPLFTLSELLPTS